MKSTSSPLLLLLVICTSWFLVYSADLPALAGKRTLVVLDDVEQAKYYSIFFKSLTDRGLELTYRQADDSELSLSAYGEWKYDQLVLFASKTEVYAPSFSPANVLAFIDDGHNVIIGADSSLKDPLRDISEGCGVVFDDEDTSVIDHQNFDISDVDGDHTLIVADSAKLIDNKLILPKKPTAPILFRGIAQQLDSSNPLLFPLLAASDYAYSANPDEAGLPQDPILGSKTILLSAMQARNNARLLFSGSLELFTDKFFTSAVQRSTSTEKAKSSGNKALLEELLGWLFQQRGVLRAGQITHHRKGESKAPDMYTIKDDVEVSITIEEYTNGAWAPFTSKHVQLEFVMLDPYVRTNLKADNRGHFATTFQLPDVYGIFTFRVKFHEKGYSFLDTSSQASVRPFRHDQYERFIASAMPYYSGAFSMMVGLALFSVIFLYNKAR